LATSESVLFVLNFTIWYAISFVMLLLFYAAEADAGHTLEMA
jgi:hypothetical protein